MLRVPLHKLKSGMILARPIPSPNDPRRYLLQRDREVPMDMIPRLKELGILDVWIRYRDLEFLEGVINEDISDHQRDLYHQVRRNFEQVMSGAALELDVSKYQDIIGDLFSILKQNSCGHILLQKLESYDNYLMSHSANVCYLALLMGMKLEQYLISERSFVSAKNAKDLQLLGLGCLLHDVGKMCIPLEILNKPAKLTAEEMAAMELHTIYGYEMVKGQIPATAAQIVLNHHQRFNGTGYPRRFDPVTKEQLPALSGKQIPVFSRIATVCDVYDAATAQRVYSPAKLPVRVLHEMRTWCKGFFDPVCEQAFYEIIPPFPLGQIVKLSNGYEAVVVDFNSKHPVRPKVQGIRDPNGDRVADPAAEEIDLALHRELHITQVDDTDVTPFLASQDKATSGFSTVKR